MLHILADKSFILLFYNCYEKIKFNYILFEKTIKQLKGIILIILFFDDYFSKYAFLFFLLSEEIIVSIWKYYSYIII